MSSEPWTAQRVKAVLYRHFWPRYAVLAELTITDPDVAALPRIERWRVGVSLDRRVDVLLVRPDDLIAVEVKVSRADYLADVADPSKQAAWRAVTNRFAYAAPEGLISPDELPADIGLIVCTAQGAEWRRRVVRRPDCLPLPDRVVRSIFLRCSSAEAHMKGYGRADAADDPEAMRARTANLERQLRVEQNRAERAAGRAEKWRKLHARCDPPPCATCDQPVIPDHGLYGGWKHLDPAHDAACEPRRLRNSRWPDPILPADPDPEAERLEAAK